jgi:hypothetical protein
LVRETEKMNNYDADELHETYEAGGHTANPVILKAINSHVTKGAPVDGFTTALLRNNFSDVLVSAETEAYTIKAHTKEIVDWKCPDDLSLLKPDAEVEA